MVANHGGKGVVWFPNKLNNYGNNTISKKFILYSWHVPQICAKQINIIIVCSQQLFSPFELLFKLYYLVGKWFLHICIYVYILQNNDVISKIIIDTKIRLWDRKLVALLLIKNNLYRIRISQNKNSNNNTIKHKYIQW